MFSCSFRNPAKGFAPWPLFLRRGCWELSSCSCTPEWRDTGNCFEESFSPISAALSCDGLAVECVFYISILYFSHWNLEIKLCFLHYCYPCPVTLVPFLLLYCMPLSWASLHLASRGLTGLSCTDLGSCGGFPHRLGNEQSWDLPWINFPPSELGPLHYAVVRPQGRNSSPAKETNELRALRTHVDMWNSFHCSWHSTSALQWH